MIRFATIERLPGYRFGDDGSVWSCWSSRNDSNAVHQYRGVSRKGRSVGVVTDNWRQLRCNPNSTGRLVLFLRTAPGRGQTFSVHRLIAEAFYGPCPEGCECCHNNGNPIDNSAENLRWDTRSANFIDKRRHGTSAAHNRKFTNEQADEIRRAYAAGEATQCQLAEQYATKQGTISLIVRGESYAHP